MWTFRKQQERSYSRFLKTKTDSNQWYACVIAFLSSPWLAISKTLPVNAYKRATGNCNMQDKEQSKEYKKDDKYNSCK